MPSNCFNIDRTRSSNSKKRGRSPGPTDHESATNRDEDAGQSLSASNPKGGLALSPFLGQAWDASVLGHSPSATGMDGINLTPNASLASNPTFNYSFPTPPLQTRAPHSSGDNPSTPPVQTFHFLQHTAQNIAAHHLQNQDVVASIQQDATAQQINQYVDINQMRLQQQVDGTNDEEASFAAVGGAQERTTRLQGGLYSNSITTARHDATAPSASLRQNTFDFPLDGSIEPRSIEDMIDNPAPPAEEEEACSKHNR
mmetsp:Transcript_101804/g.152527  ORF Transcript_101804/g.152527 Transcript_101804/m.152527 type:complete len:256 (-) Transcript_101804:1465-2232(-)|eukprot:CAMPEP_0117007404 /NCGR_PEP_ID=MMETSP0472-20121206/7297_1 /TAXON_ID=693140 ORGANISM="Tiarina fusus, Strain LIS" /NCGR_SAMPLE_ID=MMETSP0472 /ASSEMBLY_ACC=CAM_ASM_000603 /LENGTH=255 /DNA_ID=CAMNT_0004709165 /DNA_START=69 /DNA_END=836 /DNA_ORIENTATION=-